MGRSSKELPTAIFMTIYEERRVLFLIRATGEIKLKFGDLHFFYQVYHVKNNTPFVRCKE